MASSIAPATSPPASPRSRRIPRWRFWLPLSLQLCLILALPLRNSYTALTGEKMILQTVPVDPYDLLRGYSQTLRYDISNLETLAQLPGGEFLQDNLYRRDRLPLYLVFEQSPSETETGPKDLPWKPTRVSASAPQLTDDQQFLKAYAKDGEVIYNLERYYMPEDQRNELNDSIAQLQREDPQSLRVEIKVDRFGAAVPVALLIGDQRHQF